jgi:hypothetical protein
MLNVYGNDMRLNKDGMKSCKFKLLSISRSVNATVFIVFHQCLLFYNSKKYPVLTQYLSTQSLVYPVIFPV